MASHTVRGATFHFEDRGAGGPLVLVHGFPVDSRMWDAQVCELSGQCRTVAPDLRGFGQTHATDPFTMESMADDLHALLGQIGALPCVLAGLSMGGYIALAYARKYPTDLRGLMLVDTKSEGDSAQQKEGRQKMIELARSNGAIAVAEQMLPKMLADETPKRRPAVAQALRGLMEACPPKTIEHALLAMRDRPDQTPNLPSIGVPTLIIVGDHDAITPVPVAQAMQGQVPHGQLAVITGAGHMSPMEQPAQVNRAMSRFLQGIR
jgi:3-oxoadipate enol-lactonase